jgi:GTP-binding protein
MYRVAIVGRPNVGKSTLFNRLTRTRKALVGDEPGITRDRLFHTVQWENRCFELVDTGGILPGVREAISEKVFEQAAVAVSSANLVLLLVDARAGVTPLDEEVANYLRVSGTEFWVVANKVDVPAVEAAVPEFSKLGAPRILPVSAEHGAGVDDLLEAIGERVPESRLPASPDEIRIAVIGRPNVGKSSLVNRILGEERVIVSEIPGTTRDAVDSVFRWEGRQFRIVDTAGIRRRSRTGLAAEKLAVVMAHKNIGLADVVFLVLDAVEGVSKLDVAIGGYAHEEGRPLVIVVNKWDLVEKDSHTAIRLEREFRSRLRYLDYAPLVFVSALSGQRVSRLPELARDAVAGSRIRVPTSELNAFLRSDPALARFRGPSGHRFPLKYACQVGAAPPTFVLFLKGRDKLHVSTERLVANRLRERYGFFASPLRVVQKPASAGR